MLAQIGLPEQLDVLAFDALPLVGRATVRERQRENIGDGNSALEYPETAVVGDLTDDLRLELPLLEDLRDSGSKHLAH